MARRKLPPPAFRPLGDGAVRAGFGDRIDPALNRLVRAYCACLEREAIGGVTEWVPGYAAVTVYYKPHAIRYATLCEKLAALAKRAGEIELPPPEVLTLPVCYGGEFGPDLEFVTKHTGLSMRELIAAHSAKAYLIYMMGFAPGFPYLGGMNPKLAAPRLEKPRLSVPAGSVGIAGEQTGVYPLVTPGGWRVIGRTPVRLFDAKREPAALLKAGDYLRFRAVDEARYRMIEAQVVNGTYVVERKAYEDA